MRYIFIKAFSKLKFALHYVLMIAVIFGGLKTYTAYAQDESNVSTEERNADECFEAKDKACLDELFSDVIRQPSDNKKKAAYLLGLLHLKDGEEEAAKDMFFQSITFGGPENQKASVENLIEIYERDNVEFDSVECGFIEEEDCFQRIIEGDDDKAARGAQYLLGQRLYSTDPKRAFDLFSAAAKAGHKSANCELPKFYTDDGEDGVSMNYHKSITYSLECTFKQPFKKFDKKYFSKYEKKKNHKAYAHSEGGFYSYSSGITSPEIAATLALEYCKTNKFRKPDSPACKVLNVDGIWVKEPIFGELTGKVKSVDDLVTFSARKSYQNKYSKKDNPKVFAQSATGAWQWKSKDSSDLTLDDLKEKALELCNDNWRIRTGHACRLVNINGEWLDR